MGIKHYPVGLHYRKHAVDTVSHVFFSEMKRKPYVFMYNGYSHEAICTQFALIQLSEVQWSVLKKVVCVKGQIGYHEM